MSDFDTEVVSAVVGHMNGDHTDDNLLIARAFGRSEATASMMIGLDGDAGLWKVTDPSGESELRVAWPGAPISERAEIRREVVVLYRAACEKLGIEPREEEETPAQGGHPGGHPHAAGAMHGAAGAHAHAGGHPGGHPHAGGHPGGHPHGKPEDDGKFSTAIRGATWGDHSDSEGAGFMAAIMRGQATRDDYAALVAQHYFLYVALEEAAGAIAADPRFAHIHPEAIVRVPALEADLEFLYGADWRELISAVPATDRYVARIREVAAEGWLPGIVAHHYTRYLGDLSGGQMIAKAVANQHGFETKGIEFYDFGALGGIPEFKNAYRAALDVLGESLDEAERERVIDEVRTSYRFNAETFGDLSRAARARV